MHDGPGAREWAAGGAMAVLLCAQLSGPSPSAQVAQPPAPAGWAAEWVEPEAPFFSSVLDGQAAGAAFPSPNLTPRGLVLQLGRGYWVGFDTDLLRVAVAWRGRGVTPVALAPGSYHDPSRKTPGGQFPAPQPDGEVWIANGIYPGWQVGARPTLGDPREPAPSPEEVGRGPLPETIGRFTGIRHVRGGAVLEYTVGGAGVREWMALPEFGRVPAIERHVEVGPSAETLWLVLGYTADGIAVDLVSREGVAPSLETIAAPRVESTTAADRPSATGPSATRRVLAVRVPPHEGRLGFSVGFTQGETGARVVPRVLPTEAPAPRWPEEVTTKVTLSRKTGAYVVDDIGLPLDNPWRRLVRVSDVQFLTDGTGVLVTLDGDVWFARGMHDPAGRVRWRRFASGLHEPLTLAIRDDEIFVFDRNGIWRLRDTNADGEADVHELFSNVFAQTADMREFPNTLRLAPGGEFVIAKGGQEATTIGKHNGSVLRISADGRDAQVLGYGLRQPNAGVNVRTGLVTASDQQGHYIPSTPLHIIEGRQFYGFISTTLPREVYPAPIADPLTWIPHTVNASAMSQVWLFGARMGPLDDTLVHIGFNNPELFRVLLDRRGPRPQAAIVSITRDFDFPPLNGSVNPVDGQLYLAGFQILGWGTTAKRLAGLGRVRYTGAPSTLPRAVVPMDTGVLIQFDTPLDAAAATRSANYSLATWHYQRTYRYGSPQVKADGTPGVDVLEVGRAYLSQDRRSVFVAVPGMTPVMQMQVGWTLATEGGTPFKDNAYVTPYALPPFDPRAEGFGDVTLDLSAATAAVKDAPARVSVDEGARVYETYGCAACHAVDRASPARLGPTLHGLYGAPRTFANGAPPAVADEAYVRESILQPAARIVSGYEKGDTGMPSYAGVLTDAQLQSVVLYIRSLR